MILEYSQVRENKNQYTLSFLKRNGKASERIEGWMTTRCRACNLIRLWREIKHRKGTEQCPDVCASGVWSGSLVEVMEEPCGCLSGKSVLSRRLA